MNPDQNAERLRSVFARDCNAVAWPTARPFDPDRALRLIHRLAFPRAVGTPGERLAARLVERALTRSGRPVVRERFPVGTTARRVGSLLAFLGASVLVTIGVILAASWPFLSALCALGAGYLVNAPWIVTRSLADRFRARVWSDNLVTWPTTADDAEAAPARVVFLAHYDSKSQRLPTGLRVALVVSVTVGCVILVGLTLAKMVLGHVVGFWPFAVLGTVMNGCLIALMCNASGNRSPGALDNGSGLAVLLELARVWDARDDAPVEVVFLATGAEEVGLDGARAFLLRHEWWLRERPTLLINLESLGAGSRVWLAGSPGAVSLAEAVAESQSIPTARFRILGAGMDHEPFAAAGLDTVSLLGDVVGTSAVLHTPHDGIHLIDRDSLIRSARLATHLALSWADRLRRSGDSPALAVVRSDEEG
ncbi:M28 family metallopeptidase [Tautonia rosea]|uniref:M28 family metallopeptidase n=1 Tax=Tautonia rosea TaxID=2728037 RepID=UPI0014729FEA|nr:M28 family peptidase [Tautonia rosea]